MRDPTYIIECEPETAIWVRENMVKRMKTADRITCRPTEKPVPWIPSHTLPTTWERSILVETDRDADEHNDVALIPTADIQYVVDVTTPEMRPVEVDDLETTVVTNRAEPDQ